MQHLLVQIALPEHLKPIVNENTLSDYGSGRPNSEITSRLGKLTSADVTHQPTDQTMANCCLSGLWLLNNCLDRSHDISQTIKSKEGSLWHAMMHRLEGDFWNSKYWYRKVGPHPVFEQICLWSQELDSLPNSISDSETWNPEAFVDLCESVATGNSVSDSETCHQLEQMEWLAAFQFCYACAVNG